MASSQGRAMAVPRPLALCGGKASARVMVVPSSSDLMFINSAGILCVSLTSSLQKRVALDDLEDQPGEPVLARGDGVDDPVHDTGVGLFQASAQGIGQHLLGQAAGEFAMRRLEDRLQLAGPAEALARREFARGIDRRVPSLSRQAPMAS